MRVQRSNSSERVVVTGEPGDDEPVEAEPGQHHLLWLHRSRLTDLLRLHRRRGRLTQQQAPELFRVPRAQRSSLPSVLAPPTVSMRSSTTPKRR